MSDNDDVIIAELRKNNLVVLKDFYKSHYPMILNLIVFNSGTEQDAKDVYQETIIAFYEKLQQADFKLTCRIRTYLYAVGRRIWLARLRDKKKFDTRITEAETFDGIASEMDAIAEDEMDYRHMDNAMNLLGQPCQSLIEEFYIKESTMESIKEKFGYGTTDSAKNQKYKCLQRLKKLFQQHRNIQS